MAATQPEAWHIIEGFSRYEISSQGKVMRTSSGRLLKTRCCKGHLYVDLWLEGTTKKQGIGVHQLVARAFIPNPDSLPEVDHINGVRDDNHKENIRWVTKSQNMWNSKKKARNSAGGVPSSRYKGVSWENRRCCWVAYISVDHQRFHIGYFLNESDARKARDAVARRLHSVDGKMIGRTNDMIYSPDQLALWDAEEDYIDIVIAIRSIQCVGVYDAKGRFSAKVSRKHRSIHIGTYDTAEQARDARMAWLAAEANE
jgi:hypothetical protein